MNKFSHLATHRARDKGGAVAQAITDLRERGQAAKRSERVPPHDLPAEESLLGAMLLSRDAIASAVERCRAEDFYRPAHGHIFEAVCSLYAQGEPADPVTVADELNRADLLDAAGGAATWSLYKRTRRQSPMQLAMRG